ncbi:MAG: hypothetical protein ACKO96_36450 [Flammeovirgaceae bacterium]
MSTYFRTRHEKLISFSDIFVMEIDSLLTLDSTLQQSVYSDKFSDKTDTIQFSDNEIYISYLGITNGCAQYNGDIQFKGDTIILDLINKGYYVCTSETCDRIKFRIKNEGDKKYVIKEW